MVFRHPTKFWGYFGKRIKTIREAKPNKAFFLLKQLIQEFKFQNYFIVTENDHGFLEKTGFDLSKIWEVFGNANYFQCVHGKLIYNLCLFLPIQNLFFVQIIISIFSRTARYQPMTFHNACVIWRKVTNKGIEA